MTLRARRGPGAARRRGAGRRPYRAGRRDGTRRRGPARPAHRRAGESVTGAPLAAPHPPAPTARAPAPAARAAGPMALQVVALVRLPTLEAALRTHEHAPPGLHLHNSFTCDLGRCDFIFSTGPPGAGSAGDPPDAGGPSGAPPRACNVRACFYWPEGRPLPLPDRAVRWAFELATTPTSGGDGVGAAPAPAGAEPAPAVFASAGLADGWRSGDASACHRTFAWARLRAEVLCHRCPVLQLAAHAAAGPGGPSMGFPLAPRGDDVAFVAGEGPLMLNGRFADAVVRAGGREWRVHRVVLAAASPALRSMLESDMVEGRQAAVELHGADPEAVELFLIHIYGGAIDVPLRAALQLYGLADQYQLASGLARCLRVWLAAVPLSPAALAALLPTAFCTCPPVFQESWLQQAQRALASMPAHPAFAAWPADALIEVLHYSSTFSRETVVMRGGDIVVLPREPCRVETCFAAAAAWAAAQAPAEGAAHWPRLLDALNWSAATAADLRALRRHIESVPGLQERLMDACLALATRAEALLSVYTGMPALPQRAAAS
jgi:hypothetical protein